MFSEGGCGSPSGIIRPNPELSHLQISRIEVRLITFASQLEMTLDEAGHIENPSKTESLSVDYGILPLFDYTPSQGRVQDMSMTIGQLEDLGSDGLVFIQQDHSPA